MNSTVRCPLSRSRARPAAGIRRRSAPPPATPEWRHTFHALRALPRLVLDYVLLRDRLERVASARVARLDEHPLDRGATVFGSDHHPLVARVALHPPGGIRS